MIGERHLPLVSIILPAYNAENTIAAAIASVLDQTYTHWELIIVENGSTDGTFEACRQVQDERIALIRYPQAGLSRARNIGLDRAKGEFVCFLDSDDLLPPKSISLRLALFAQNPNLSYCDGIVLKKSENLDTLIEEWHPQVPIDLAKEMNKIDARCFCGVTWMIQTSHIQNLRFDENWSHLEDRKFFYELAQTGVYGAVEEPVYIIRSRRGSLMTNHKKLQLAYRRFLQFVEDHGQLSKSELTDQRRFYKRMFFKTHLKSGRFIPALGVLFEH
jgi:glycosyltransferase involved in cell wall biosynthesis